MPPRTTPPLRLALVLWLPGAAALAATPSLESQFAGTVHPFVQTYCLDCHSGAKAKGDLDLSTYPTLASVVAGGADWEAVLDKIESGEMPSEKAKRFPTDAARQDVAGWIRAVLADQAEKNAGDPGIVLARRLSNAEYDYSIRDLTGVDLRPAREFPVDPANTAGFDNSGESLDMSPTLLNKYLQAARDVADHLVLTPGGFTFAARPMLVETDRDDYCVHRIVDFYHRQDTDYADYFQAAWRFRHRAALGRAGETLADEARASGVSAPYLAAVRRLLETPQEVGPGARLQALWKALPAPAAGAAALREGCERMRDYVVAVRAKVEVRFPNLSAGGIRGTAEPFLMWRNRQYATHRTSFDPADLQVAGEPPPAPRKKAGKSLGIDDINDAILYVQPVQNRPGDPDLAVPAGQRARYEAAFGRFCAVFPDAFYVSERGRNYFDKTKDKGRLLSAGFHNIMGYFRDDQPLYDLVLDDAGRRELDELWREMDFVASTTARTYVQFYFNESSEARERAKGAAARPSDADVTTETAIRAVQADYRAKAAGNALALQAIDEHFSSVDATLRETEKARTEAEPVQLQALFDFAARAYRRPLAEAERADLLAFYRSLRRDGGLSHEDALRDSVVGVLMSPDFCYRIDLAPAGPGIHPLSDYALASRLSYFLWASGPDHELLERAAAGDLHRPEVIKAEARRMLRDPRVRGLALEFGGNWLDFRRFDEINTVDRQRFATFTNDLREAMFEEPVRFLVDLFQNDRPVLDLLYARRTFVNAALAAHYGMSPPAFGPDGWAQVDDADRYGRGGVLPMAAFLTENAPGLRTSPVKRGYWVVKRVLGERIPPPPAVVPELPRDEAKMELPLRQMLARHREDKACSVCHAKFDSFGLVFEGYGPVGERREKDLGGHPVDAGAVFPGGAEETGLEGLKAYLRASRQDEFVDNFCRKLLAYGLGRSPTLSDEPTVRSMKAGLAAGGYRFDTLVESIVTSRQFLNQRGRDGKLVAMKGE